MRRLMAVTLMLAVVGLLTVSTLPIASPMLASSEEKEIKIVMGKPEEMRFEPGELKLKAGETYKLKLINEGRILHEIMIGKGGVKLEEGKPHGYNENFFEKIEVKIERIAAAFNGLKVEIGGFEIETEGLEEVELEPGREMELEFTVPGGKKGEWEYGCFVPGHYEAGMKGKLVVE